MTRPTWSKEGCYSGPGVRNVGESWERLARIGSMQKCILERKEQGMAVNPIGVFGTGRTNSDPYEGYYRAYYGNARNPLNYRQMMSGNDQNSVYKSEDTIKPGRLSAPSECQTCKNRKYQDGSNEMDVSFKSAAHISVKDAPAKVRAHEQEHVANAYQKAKESNGKVLQASVSIKTAICPECGTTYVAGGETSTKIKYPVDKKAKESIAEDTGLGKFFDASA